MCVRFVRARSGVRPVQRRMPPTPPHLNPGNETNETTTIAPHHLGRGIGHSLGVCLRRRDPRRPLPYFPEPTTVTVSPATAELTALGATVQLSAEVRDQNGQVMSGTTVTWASSTAAVATVSASGLVTAVANGTATITATAGPVSGSATVRVAQEVSAVAVTPDTATVLEGDTLRLAATATDANGQVVTGAELAWASGDTAVAVVDASGLVTGVAAGQVQVTATAAGLTGRAELAVVPPLPTTIAVTPDTVVLTAVGQTAQLTAEVRDQAGRVMDGVPVAWLSRRNNRRGRRRVRIGHGGGRWCGDGHGEGGRGLR